MRTTTKCTRRFYLSLGCFSITASLVLFLIVVFLFNQDCPGCPDRSQEQKKSSYLVTILGTVATLLFFLGGSLLTACWNRGQNSPIPRVMVSLIPEEDLEKSPAPILPYNHIPHYQPFVVKAPSLDLPDYFSVAQNVDELFPPSVEAEVWTENDPEIPPPCYEQALEMAALAASAGEDGIFNSKQVNTEDTNV
ncbi:uncharacterized protein LOC144630288 [Oculina patagonica]